jgi:hypothetical protein
VPHRPLDIFGWATGAGAAALADASGAGVGVFSSLVIFTLRGEGRRGEVEGRGGGRGERE